jgi:hypothetical protein
MKWNRQGAVEEVLKRAEKDFRGVSIVLDATAGSTCPDPSDPGLVCGVWKASAQGLRERLDQFAGVERADLEGLIRVMEMYEAELEIVAGIGELSGEDLPPSPAPIRVDLVFDWPRWGTHRKY